jgi:membrane protein DedA with SNARE-associated domain
MNEVIQSLVAHGGPVLFAVVFVDQAGLPLPSVPWLLAAGALSVNGEMNAAVAIGTSVGACLIADSLWFYVGRRGGSRIVQLLCRLSLAPNSGLRPTKGLLRHQGLRGLIITKFLPGLGNVMPAVAGAFGVSTASFLVFDTLGSFLYGAFYIVLGVLFHNRLQQVMALLKHFGFIALLLLLVPALAYIVLQYFWRRTQHRALVTGPTSAKTFESRKPLMSMCPE